MDGPWFPVDASDIESRFRTLTDAESGVIDAMIADAQDVLEARLIGLGVTDKELAASPYAFRQYVRVVAQMIIRVFRNPEGFLTETIDGYTYRRDSVVSAGVLDPTDAELDQLRPNPARRTRGAFTITPA